MSAHPRVVVALAMLASSLSVCLPHLQVVSRYWDGPLYMYVAKTLYVVPEDNPFGLSPAYFASHLPVYPLLIRGLILLTGGHYGAAMLLATLFSSMAAAVLFYEVLRAWDVVGSPLWTAILFSFLPPRWPIYHSVGAPEPLFLCFVFAAFLAMRAGRSGYVAVFATLATLTRINGIVAAAGLAIVYLRRRDAKGFFLLALAPLGLLILCGAHWLLGHGFLAIFSWNLTTGRLAALPFESLRRTAEAENFTRTELVAGLYFAYALGTLALWRRRELFIFCALFFAVSTLLVHRDLSRYLLPIAPFALLVGFDPILTSKPCRWVLPLLIYLDCVYAWGALPRNLMDAGAYQALLTALGG